MRVVNFLWYGILLTSTAFVIGIARSDSPKGWTADGADVRTETQSKKTIHAVTPTKSVGYLWLDGVTFREGTIEADMKGKGAFGIAYGVPDGPERVVVMPRNFADGKGESIEYVSPIDTGRQPQKPNSVRAIKAPPNGSSWFHVKVDVKLDTVRIFVGDAPEPSLVVDRSQKTKAGKAGLCVPEGSEASFANFKVTPYDDAAPKAISPKKIDG
jgi:hypothetical protein